MLLNNQCIIGEIKQEIKNTNRQMKMKAHLSKTNGTQQNKF